MENITQELQDQLTNNPEADFVDNLKGCASIEAHVGVQRSRWAGYTLDELTQAWEDVIDPHFTDKIDCINAYDEAKRSLVWYRASDRSLLQVAETPFDEDPENWRLDFNLLQFASEQDFLNSVQKIIDHYAKPEPEEEP